jgi:Cys-tRNA(Pro)/Cys-tRNA(Cys) deacylase
VASLGQRALDALGVAYVSHEYDYRKKGAIAAAEALRAALGALLKTLVVRLADGSFALLLVPGDCDASMRALARHLGVKDAELASERDAERVTGYLVGGIGPFGVRTALPVFVDIAASRFDSVWVNGGRRGLLLELGLDALVAAAGAQLVDVCIEPMSRKG